MLNQIKTKVQWIDSKLTVPRLSQKKKKGVKAVKKNYSRHFEFSLNSTKNSLLLLGTTKAQRAKYKSLGEGCSGLINYSIVL